MKDTWDYNNRVMQVFKNIIEISHNAFSLGFRYWCLLINYFKYLSPGYSFLFVFWCDQHSLDNIDHWAKFLTFFCLRVRDFESSFDKCLQFDGKIEVILGEPHKGMDFIDNLVKNDTHWPDIRVFVTLLIESKIGRGVLRCTSTFNIHWNLHAIHAFVEMALIDVSSATKVT